MRVTLPQQATLIRATGILVAGAMAAGGIGAPAVAVSLSELLGQFTKKVGEDHLSDVLRQGLSALWKRRGGGDADEDALRGAFVRAYVAALDRVEEEFFALHSTGRLPDNEREAIRALLRDLRAGAHDAIAGPGAVPEGRELELYLDHDHERAAVELWQRADLVATFRDYDGGFVDHLRRQLPALTQRYFDRELRSQSPAGTAASRAYTIGVMRELRAVTEQIRDGQDETHAVLARIEALVAASREAAPPPAPPDSGKRVPVDELLDAAAWDDLDVWLRLLHLINRDALDVYREWVEYVPPSRPSRLWTDFWTHADLDDQRRWVAVRDERTREDAVAHILLALHRSGEDPTSGTHGRPVRKWLLGEAGTGKTTVLYRAYFRYLAERDAADGAPTSPEPMLIQPRRLGPGSISELNEAEQRDLVRTIVGVWLGNRGIGTTPAQLGLLTESFQRQLSAGTVVLFVDGFDEISRMQVQRNLSGYLFDLTRHFVCASRWEAFRGWGDEDVVELARCWDLPTIERYLRTRFRHRAPEWLDAEVGEFLRHLRVNEGLDWVRNPRYLNLLLNPVDGAGELAGSSSLLAAAQEGEYALLQRVVQVAMDRLHVIAEWEGRLPLERLEPELRKRLERIAAEQLRSGACEVPADEVAADPHWGLLARASGVVRDVGEGDTAHDFGLTSFTFIDFFLARPIADAIEHERRSLDADHRWSVSLVHFLSAELRARQARRPRDGSALKRVWEKLRRSGTRLPRLRDDEACRLADADASATFPAANLLHLAIRIQLDESGVGSREPEEVRRGRVCIRDLNLRNLDLAWADLHGVRFERCHFDGSVLADANLERATFDHCDFLRVNLRRANALSATFDHCEFDFHRYPADQSPVKEMLVQDVDLVVGKEIDLSLATFEAHGAELERSRYLTQWGRDFLKRQALFLGPGLRDAERECYLPEITSFVEKITDRPVYLVDLMAGGSNDRLLSLMTGAESRTGDGAPSGFSNLRVLAIDRETRNLAEVEDRLGTDRFTVAPVDIRGRIGLAQELRRFEDKPATADIIIGKKALHELPRAAQRELVAECAEVLRPGGAFVLFADAPACISRHGYRRLTKLARPLREGETSQRRLQSFYLHDLRFGDTPDDRAIFSNLWVLLKDWANGNVREARNRYFSSADEIARWGEHDGGLRLMKPPMRRTYHMVARRFNESGVNQVRRYLERTGYLIRREDHARIREMLVGDHRHALFYAFADTHLWDADRGEPTALGAVLGARRGPVDFSLILQELREIEMPPEYEDAVGFDFDVHVLSFRKPGEPEGVKAPPATPASASVEAATAPTRS